MLDAAGAAWLKLRVTAPADRGAANRAVLRLVAKAAGVAPRDVSLVSGGTARNKTLIVAGDAAVLARRLAPLAEPGRTT